MGTKMIPLGQLESDPSGTLNECCDSGAALVVELLDKRMVTIQPLEPDEDDSLVSGLLESNAAFRALVERSKSSPRKPFPCRIEVPRPSGSG